MNSLFLSAADFAGTDEASSAGEGQHGRGPADVKPFAYFVPATHNFREQKFNLFSCLIPRTSLGSFPYLVPGKKGSKNSLVMLAAYQEIAIKVHRPFDKRQVKSVHTMAKTPPGPACLIFLVTLEDEQDPSSASNPPFQDIVVPSCFGTLYSNQGRHQSEGAQHHRRDHQRTRRLDVTWQHQSDQPSAWTPARAAR